MQGKQVGYLRQGWEMQAANLTQARLLCRLCWIAMKCYTAAEFVGGLALHRPDIAINWMVKLLRCLRINLVVWRHCHWTFRRMMDMMCASLNILLMLVLLIHVWKEDVVGIFCLLLKLGSGTRVGVVGVSCVWAGRSSDFSWWGMELVLVVHWF